MSTAGEGEAFSVHLTIYDVPCLVAVTHLCVSVRERVCPEVKRGESNTGSKL